ncbi:DUF2786 domain-containing protein [Streptomyces sp. NRRL F-5123]|uniref:DUF2786 domain-containing protein n=1 Tax=Streptomyces sp. NRRL F-5123 TaxID=1463856 RepID=UPI0004E262A8|nr:DUF2786 domain-containing protein [Streptomyces sp. NRRL F-5123]
MSNENPKLKQIRALLAKAEDPGAHPDEALAYFAKAAELMAKYGIERAMLAEADPKSDKIVERSYRIKGTYVVDRADLLTHIAKALGGQTVYWALQDSSTRRRYRLVKIVAFESTLDRIDMLFNSLVLQAFNGVNRGRPQWGESTTAYRKAWHAGFRNAVFSRLVQAEHLAAEETTPTTAGRSAELVLSDRKQMVVAEYERLHPKVRKAGPRKITGSGFGEGKEAGHRADLGQTRIGGRHKSLAR